MTMILYHVGSEVVAQNRAMREEEEKRFQEQTAALLNDM